MSFAAKPRLAGELVLLRPVEATDAAGLQFDVVRVHRIELQVYDFNPRARHVYENLGFVLEGTRRDALRWDGQWIDCHLMGLLDRDRRFPRTAQ